MITEVNRDSIQLPFPNDGSGDVCLPSGALNPLCAAANFRQFPWLPFQDMYLEASQVSRLAHACGQDVLYHQTMPCRESPCRYFSVDAEMTDSDISVVQDWLQYDEGITWTADGNIIINSYSDFVVLGLADHVAHALFGQTVDSLFRESDSIFTRRPTSAEAEEFLTLAQRIRP